MTATSAELATLAKAGPDFISVTSPQPMMPQRIVFMPAIVSWPPRSSEYPATSPARANDRPARDNFNARGKGQGWGASPAANPAPLRPPLPPHTPAASAPPAPPRDPPS